jgi:SpoIVB peptidase S55.
MKAEVRTVVSGTKIISFPVKILGIVPRKETPRNLILIQGEGPLMETVGIAQGMSGSPVYVGGKLVGAIGYGWPFSDKRLGLVTPIEDMVKIFDWRDKIPSFSPAPKISNEPMSPDVRKQPAPLVSPDQKTASPDKKGENADRGNLCRSRGCFAARAACSPCSSPHDLRDQRAHVRENGRGSGGVRCFLWGESLLWARHQRAENYWPRGHLLGALLRGET